MGLFEKLKQGLKKTAQFLNTDIRDLFKSEGQLVDDEFVDELFETLIKTDMGVEAAQEIADEIRTSFRARVVKMDEILEQIKAKLKAMLAQPADPIRFAASGPTVIMVAGVNGGGQDDLDRQAGLHVPGRGQEGRAGGRRHLPRRGGRAVDHLGQAAGGGDRHRRLRQRSGQRGPSRRRPGPADRRRRLHRRHGRPAANPAEPDAGADQDPSRAWASRFPTPRTRCSWSSTPPPARTASARPGISPTPCAAPGLVLAKLDGTAKGGVVVAIRKKVGLPVKYIGVGEKAEDLALFEPDKFVDALFEDMK